MTDLTLGDYTLDNGLAGLKTACNEIWVCSAAPSDYASAVTNQLGTKSFGAGSAFDTVGAGSPSGRAISSIAVTDGSITTTGTVACWAAVDSSGSALLAQGTLSGGGSVTATQQWTLDSFSIHLNGTTGAAPLILDTLATTCQVAFSCRKVRSAYAGGPALVLMRNTTTNPTLEVAFSGNEMDETSGANGLTNAAIYDGSTSSGISVWHNQGTNGSASDFTATATQTCPILTAGGTLQKLNGKMAPRFTNNDNYFGSMGGTSGVFAALSSTAITQPCSVAACIKYVDLSATSMWFGDSGQPEIGITSAGPNYAIAAGVLREGGTPETSNVHSIFGVFDTTSTLYVDNTSSAVISNTAGTNSIFGDGTANSALCPNADGRALICEIFVFEGALPKADMDLLKADWVSRYGAVA